VAYELELPALWKGHNVFNEKRLKRFHEPSFLTQHKAPAHPDPEFKDEGQTEYEVKEVLDKRQSANRVEYLVRWEGYGPKDDSWEPSLGLTNAKKVVWDYEARG
jgi:hypothetical protein